MTSFLRERVGFVNFQYFEFLRMLIIYNSIMGLIGMYAQTKHWRFTGIKITNSFTISSFFVSEKGSLVFGGLLETVIILIAFVYAKRDRLQVYPQQSRRQTLLDEIPTRSLKNERLKKLKRFISALVMSLIILFVVIAAILIGNFNIIQATPSQLKRYQNYLLASLVALIQIQSQNICFTLTSIEEHSTWSSWRESYFIKLLILKIAVTQASLIGVSINSLTMTNAHCSIPNYAILLIFLSFTLKYTMTMISFILYKVGLSKQPEFDLEDEFSGILHKIFISFSAYFSFPTIGLFVSVLFICHFCYLNLCLMYIYKKPIHPSKSLLALVNSSFCTICLLSLISSRIAFLPGFVEVFFFNKCLKN